MAMVVMGGMCVHAIRTTISNLQAPMLETVFYSLRLFVVGGECIVMAKYHGHMIHNILYEPLYLCCHGNM